MIKTKLGRSSILKGGGGTLVKKMPLAPSSIRRKGIPIIVIFCWQYFAYSGLRK